MNKILAGILHIVEAGAVTVVPGAAAIDETVHAVAGVIKDGGDKEAAIEQGILAGFDELALLKPDAIYDYPTFKANVTIAHDAIVRAIDAIKKPTMVQ